MGKSLLTFSIVKRYPTFSLECTAAFESGIIAVFGPSGSGKTTLLNCIAGLITPDDGEIEILGHTVYSSSKRRNLPPEKRRCGYVFQDAALFPHMDVEQNINYGYKLTPPHRRRIEPEQLIEMFQLSALLDRNVAGLSGGERQRVALARALAVSPSLLLLDEPLASLDVAFRGIIIRYLKHIWLKLQTPMIYVSHSISEVISLSENALVLNDGKPVAQGRSSQIFVHPGVRALADYVPLQNLFEAEVESVQKDKNLAVLIVGSTRLLASAVHVQPDEIVTISISASDIVVALDRPSKISAQNVIYGKIEEIHSVGTQIIFYVDIGALLMVEVTSGVMKGLNLHVGKQVYLIVKSTSIIMLHAGDDNSSL